MRAPRYFIVRKRSRASAASSPGSVRGSIGTGSVFSDEDRARELELEAADSEDGTLDDTGELALLDGAPRSAAAPHS